MPYHIEREGNNYKVVVDSTGKVVGTHPSKIQAQAQLGALYANVKEVRKCMTCGCDDLGNDHHYISDAQKCIYCMEKGQGPCWDGYSYAGTKEQDGKTVPNCIPVKKADGGYQPNSGMKAAARRALKWKEDGVATGAGTPVGWGRASDIVAGRSMSLDTVKRMYSFFSRHEVDKKGKDWDKPSHGKIMWNAWGGDAGYAWSRAIVAKENKIKKERGTINGDSSANSGRISGGVGWKIEFNTPDCQHGWSVIKMGSGQSIGCFFKEEDAKAALEALAVTEPIVKDEANGQTKQNEQDGIGSFSFWNGAFGPVMGIQNGDMGWKSTYNTPPQNDGKPSVGYGNHSDPKGRSNQ